MNIQKYKVGKAPPSAFVIPDFITEDEEEILLKNIQKNVKKWVDVSDRRIQMWGGTPHENGMIAESIPEDGKYVNKQFGRLYLPNRSLNIITEDLYEKYKHGISFIEKDFIRSGAHPVLNEDYLSKEIDCVERGTRISITMRHVPKVKKINCLALKHLLPKA